MQFSKVEAIRKKTWYEGVYLKNETILLILHELGNSIPILSKAKKFYFRKEETVLISINTLSFSDKSKQMEFFLFHWYRKFLNEETPFTNVSKHLLCSLST